MQELRVSQLAQRAGVAASTVRFYERAGLLAPPRRAGNGYRVFDESALDVLAFVGRAKGIGMSLADIADLLAAWRVADCRQVRSHLRAFLGGRLTRTREQLVELATFEARLHAVQDRLSASHSDQERCSPGCGCEMDLDLSAAVARPEPAQWGCTLSRDALVTRVAQWRALADKAESIQRSKDTVRLVLPAGAGTIATVTTLCAAETQCCAQTRFGLEITSQQIVLTAAAPGAPGLLDALFPGAGEQDGG